MRGESIPLNLLATMVDHDRIDEMILQIGSVEPITRTQKRARFQELLGARSCLAPQPFKRDRQFLEACLR